MSNFNQSKYIQQYTKENYDRVVLQLPKGQRERIKAKAKENGLSMNAWISQLINDKLSDNMGGVIEFSQFKITRVTIYRPRGPEKFSSLPYGRAQDTTTTFTKAAGRNCLPPYHTIG